MQIPFLLFDYITNVLWINYPGSNDHLEFSYNERQ